MNIVEMLTDEVIPYIGNPRDNDGAVDAVAKSIKEFGFKQPIVVDKNNVVIVGHTRLKAAEKLGMKKVPVIVATDLTDEQIKAYRLADNKTNEIANWDIPLLNAELEDISEIFNMEDFGFDFSAEPGSDEQATEDEQGNVFEEKHKVEKGISIVYEIAFSDTFQQEEWYTFLRDLKTEYPDEDTISGRIMLAVKEWESNHGR